MTRLCVFILCAAVAGCATLSEHGELTETERAGAAYGAFLAAQNASFQEDREASTAYYRSALEAEPNDPFLIETAFMAALTNGDLDEAARLAERPLSSPTAIRIARMLRAARAVKEGRYQRAVDLIEGEDLGPFNRVVGSLILAWAYVGLDQTDAAVDALEPPGDAPVLGHLTTLHRALVLDRAGRTEEAEAAYHEALETGLLRSLVVDAYGRKLERAGRRAEAQELYASQLMLNSSDVIARSGLERIAERRRPERVAATPADGASLGVFAPAATLASTSPSSLAVVYLRLALYLDPDNGAARELLGGLLADAGLDRDALEVYSGAKRGSPFYVRSKIAEAWALFGLTRDDEAIAVLEALDQETRNDSTRRALADGYRIIGRNAEALELYDALVRQAEAASGGPGWELYYWRAVALQANDRWPEAEADFERALALEPDQPVVLNHLGYTWVDRGENLEQAFEMIRRAVELEPRAGYIVDSLGWAHFKLGEFDAAVTHLERAAELEPDDPTINDHLGDAYWRVGRRLEASYQWRFTLSLSPDDAMRVALEAKLEDGLPPLQLDAAR